nr:MAG TPA: hypothetical protein [Bacteriophage sp.]
MICDIKYKKSKKSDSTYLKGIKIRQYVLN